MNLETKKYRTDLIPIEVDARGIVGRPTYDFLIKIGLSSRENKGYHKDVYGRRSGIILDLAHEKLEEVLNGLFRKAGEISRFPV